MYWIWKQISIHCGIGIFVDDKNSPNKIYYFGHFSDDKDHDQVYVKKSLECMLSVLPSNETVIIRSDNATHFKSAERYLSCLYTLLLKYERIINLSFMSSQN